MEIKKLYSFHPLQVQVTTKKDLFIYIKLLKNLNL